MPTHFTPSSCLTQTRALSALPYLITVFHHGTKQTMRCSCKKLLWVVKVQEHQRSNLWHRLTLHRTGRCYQPTCKLVSARKKHGTFIQCQHTMLQHEIQIAQADAKENAHVIAEDDIHGVSWPPTPPTHNCTVLIIRCMRTLLSWGRKQQCC